MHECQLQKWDCRGLLRGTRSTWNHACESIAKTNLKALKNERKKVINMIIALLGLPDTIASGMRWTMKFKNNLQFFLIKSAYFPAQSPNPSVTLYRYTSILSNILCIAQIIFTFSWYHFGLDPKNIQSLMTLGIKYTLHPNYRVKPTASLRDKPVKEVVGSRRVFQVWLCHV